MLSDRLALETVKASRLRLPDIEVKFPHDLLF
jgi:hypothetical protein